MNNYWIRLSYDLKNYASAEVSSAEADKYIILQIILSLSCCLRPLTTKFAHVK